MKNYLNHIIKFIGLIILLESSFGMGENNLDTPLYHDSDSSNTCNNSFLWSSNLNEPRSSLQHLGAENNLGVEVLDMKLSDTEIMQLTENSRINVEVLTLLLRLVRLPAPFSSSLRQVSIDNPPVTGAECYQHIGKEISVTYSSNCPLTLSQELTITFNVTGIRQISPEELPIDDESNPFGTNFNLFKYPGYASANPKLAWILDRLTSSRIQFFKYY